ncbi:MAG TPA: Nif3-like dinuclear metal center hexameric protein [Sulfurovum sp.]|jgi:dinuclear metal center YbgI/SA1388 family protein|nr:MAG: Nif3-like dinuclear metal center hexameric protein [Sulfurovum sp. 35-42-20]OYY56179.1 MAG: Nif3-like dinuclear metal center hexameric protein [Sulfurovum sp. 28-43-6]OYZ25839.1 MAG: Nif3-like dinuclear metal center hexameric protein [Sulfurovum sp. 16-42-52]OYZ49450.1 MAG: Nif3-like dinuclear metal center hexameric protein [Sulfurovum sp. 24-42-9]OZA45219.1 MAG: Nif3-like dinuclear metal center hexameric protein [Sulfurovum sp. 17-42-90]OZA59928.1 MAG: Nif3-like dinuclear metal center
MKLQEIYNHLNTISPFLLQEKWDNSGLIVGEWGREVSEVVVSLDIDSDMIEDAKEGTLFVVHHPLIFGKLTQLDFAKYPANLLEKMILKKQSLIAMHTNFDKTHLNQYVFEKVLGFKARQQSDFLCTASGEWELDALLSHLKEKFALPTLKVVNPKEKIGSIALCTGAGASLMDEVEADCFLTGDIKYHDAMKAMSENLMMVDVGHYESERFFAEIMAGELKVLPLLVIIAHSKNPFHSETL